MGVIGIITCESLELEFAHLLATDPDLSGVTVLEDNQSARLIKTLESNGVQRLRRIPHISSFTPEHSEQPEALVRVLELALHRRKKTLRKGLISASHEINSYADVLLLGYGLCGGALDNPQELLDIDIPVFIPMDNDHPVDDCVGLLIGGRECYHAEQCKTPGTFFMTPEWTYHWKKLFASDDLTMNPHIIKRIFKRYKRSLLILTPVMSMDEMKRNSGKFNENLNLRLETCKGTMEILYKTWNMTKAFLKDKDCLVMDNKL